MLDQVVLLLILHYWVMSFWQILDLRWAIGNMMEIRISGMPLCLYIVSCTCTGFQEEVLSAWSFFLFAHLTGTANGWNAGAFLNGTLFQEVDVMISHAFALVIGEMSKLWDRGLHGLLLRHTSYTWCRSVHQDMTKEQLFHSEWVLLRLWELLEHHIIPCRSYWRLGQRMPSTFAELWSDQWDRKSTTDERTFFFWTLPTLGILPFCTQDFIFSIKSAILIPIESSIVLWSHKLLQWNKGQWGNDFPIFHGPSWSIMVACATRPLFICALSLYQCEDGSGPSIAEQLGIHPQARCCQLEVLAVRCYDRKIYIERYVYSLRDKLVNAIH